MPTKSNSLLPEGIEPLGISALTQDIKAMLEGKYANVWVTGEISNVARPQSGHLYLTLKDSGAQLKCVLYRGVSLRLRFDLRDGLEVFARGRISIYAPQGQHQLTIEECHPKGLGAVDLALRQLKEKLLAKGYFDPRRKKPLPPYPSNIALVTSPTGAAVRDMLEFLARRWPSAHVYLFPVRVQGESAAREIAAAIRSANQLQRQGSMQIDAMIVGRGGGSLEDLWAFNEEVVADAIFASTIPIVSAVGHEIDVTIADMVADHRALTPSQAISLVTPDRAEFMMGLKDYRRQFDDAISHRIELARQRLSALAQRRAMRLPLDRIHEAERRLDELGERLHRASRRRLDRGAEQLAALAGQLESLSPLNVLARGYTLTRSESTGNLLRESSSVRVGDRLRTTLSQGEIISRIEVVSPAPIPTDGSPRSE